MVAAKRAYESLLEQPLLTETGAHRLDEANGQIRLARFKELGGGFREPSQINRHVRSDLPQPLHEARHQRDLRDIRRIQAESPVGIQRVENYVQIEGGLEDVFRALQ